MAKSFWQRGEDYAKKVSSEIIDQIKAGVAPWQKPWKPGEQISAENFSTGQKYSGGNSLYLMSRAIRDGRGDNRWGTYNQIREAGGQVRKGEKGTQVLFFTDRNSRVAKDEKGQTMKNKEGKTIYEEQKRETPICKQYTVFNVEQAEGLELKPREGQVRPEWDAHRDAEKVIAASGPTVQHVAGDRAYYRMAEDKIVLPEPGQFPTRNGYYQTALHECGHATGHPDRMNRETLKDGLEKGFGSPEYAREELRAEISAMMTGERVGVGHDPQRGAAYVENWVKVLEKDPHEIHRAARDAQCLNNRKRRLRRHTETIEERFKRDRQALLPLPPTPYDACDKRTTRVTSLSLVRYRANDYSVPTRYGHRQVLLKGYVDEIVICCGSEEIAGHSPRLQCKLSLRLVQKIGLVRHH